MDNWLAIFSAVVGVFIIIAVGGGARGIGWLTHEADESLLKIVVRVLLPCFMFSKIVGNPAMEQASNILLSPAVGFVTTAGGCALALLVARTLGRRIGLGTPAQVGTFALCVGVFNYGFIPIPLIESVFPDRAATTMGVLFAHNVGVELAMWTVGLIVLSGRLDAGWYRRLINPPSITLVVAVAANLAQVTPNMLGPVFDAIEMIGRALVPMSMILIGATIADHVIEAKLHSGLTTALAASVLRLGVLPALFLLGAVALPTTKELALVMVVEAAMPSAVFPIVMSRHYGGDPQTALRVVIGTSALSLITMPLWLGFGAGWMP